MKEFSSDGIASQFVPRISTIVLLAVFVGGLFFVDLSSLIPEDKDGEQQPSTAFSLLTGGEKTMEENPGTSPTTTSTSETTTSTPPETTTSPTDEKQDDKGEGSATDNSHDSTGAVKEPAPNQQNSHAPQNGNTAPQNNNYRPPAYQPPLPRYTPPAPSPSSTPTPSSEPSEQQGEDGDSRSGDGAVMRPQGAPSPSLAPKAVE